ncbi:RNA polymerase sigma factor [Ureibacillus thermosphaericus]|uniref:RNA polymerase sigma factor n=1 Tax=Ureibacillus thermosphaericus TaxID=51173 RepID=UPI000BBC0B15|nr:RNA polymerase sigma factor [Ureibacillus thermosphaericus]
MNVEEIWIRKIKRNGNEAAANKLISKYYKEMYAFVYKQTLNKELALDLTQEIFIVVLKSIKNYDNKRASFRTWLYHVASNRLIDYYRSKNYKIQLLEDPIEDYQFQDEENIQISLEYKEDYEKVTQLINHLETSSQQILRLRLFAEYTFREIATMVMLPESTVKTKYYAALKQLRKRLEGYHE